MTEISIRDSWLDEARFQAKQLGVLKKSFTRGDGNVAGMLGEIIVAHHIGGEIRRTYNYDIISAKGKRIDVKTKRCNSAPLPHYECSIAAYNTTQKCDYYIFVRVLNSFKTAWICGYIGHDEYFSLAKFYKKGYIDVSNNMEFSEDAYNLPINQLHKIC